MKDPKVIELVKQFDKDLKVFNKTWAALQKHNVFVRASIKGNATYADLKYLEVEEITQQVEYLKDSKEIK
jgi:hypothetical protein